MCVPSRAHACACAKRDACALLCSRTWDFLLLLGRFGAGAAAGTNLRPYGIEKIDRLDGLCDRFCGVSGHAFYVVWSALFLSLWTNFSEYDGDPGLYAHVVFQLNVPDAAKSVENARGAIAMHRFVIML